MVTIIIKHIDFAYYNETSLSNLGVNMADTNRDFAESFLDVTDRNQVTNTKWEKYAGQDILPMWVADMDFPSPTPIITAIKARAEHGIFGYQDEPQPALVDAVLQYIYKHYDWKVEPEWLVWSQGMVPMLNATSRAIIGDGGKSMTLTPVYYHLFKGPDNWVQAPEDSIRVSLRYTPEKTEPWDINWDALEAAVTADTKLFMLCNPHNPVGIAYNKETLTKLTEFCLRHNLILCSDEIHCQLLLNNQQHIPIASLSKEIANQSITLMAPSKTYNIPGLGCTFAIIPNPELRAKIEAARAGILPVGNIMGFIAAEAAYRDCDKWLEDLIGVINSNYQTLHRTLQPYTKVKLNPLSATYLAWLDVTDLHLNNTADFFESFGLGLSPGDAFLPPKGYDFVRINLGCQPSQLEEACRRFTKALDSVL
jgi:cystathionine beta-lyase